MLQVDRLVKVYNRVPVVREVSFRLGPGEILGYLGPNGAGKSTTLKMLVGLLRPDGGILSWNGQARQGVDDLDWRRMLGYVPEASHLYPFLTGEKHLLFFARLHGITDREARERMEPLLRALAFNDVDLYLPVERYSKGMRQKILLAGSLLHGPRLLLLDEPFSGLDTLTTRVFRELLALLAREGTAILFSSHILEVVESVCARVLIINKGQVVADGTLEELKTLRHQASLEGIFHHLVTREDPGVAARSMVEVVLEARRQRETV